VTFVQLNNDFGTTQSKKEERNTMSTIALLNDDGTMYKPLRLTTLPLNYRIPDGKIVSWRMDITGGSMVFNFDQKKPYESHFYFGSAWGQITCENLPDDRESLHSFNRRRFRITVQGTRGSDVMKVRDHILTLVENNGSWEAVNDLNPQPRFLERLANALSTHR
jgi:hypothetical protein